MIVHRLLWHFLANTTVKDAYTLKGPISATETQPYITIVNENRPVSLLLKHFFAKEAYLTPGTANGSEVSRFSELALNINNGKFSFSLHSLDIIRTLICNAIELNMPLIHTYQL